MGGLVVAALAGLALFERNGRSWGGFLVYTVIALVWLLGAVGSEWYRQRRFRIGRATHPNEPWKWDGHWRPDGQELAFDRTRIAWRQLLWAFGFAALAVTFWVVTHEWIIAAVLAVPASGLAWSGFLNLRTGALRLTLPEFPLFAGSRGTFLLGVSEGGARFDEAIVVLRCVQEHRKGKPRFESVWETHRVLDPDALPGPGNDVRVQFDIPATERGTRLDVREPCWWELDVIGQTDRGPVHERFLVPVYARPPV